MGVGDDTPVLGVDSGSNGALCARTVSGSGSFLTLPIPWRWERNRYAKALLDAEALGRWYETVLTQLGKPSLVMIEAPQLRAGGPGKMVNTLESVSSSWWQAGQLDYFFRARGLEIEYCTPPQWQRLLLWPYLHQVVGLALPKRDGNKNVLAKGWPKGNDEWKAASIAFVRHEYGDRVQLVPPRCKVAHDGIADSVGVAGYGALVLGGLPHERAWLPAASRARKDKKRARNNNGDD